MINVGIVRFELTMPLGPGFTDRSNTPALAHSRFYFHSC